MRKCLRCETEMVEDLKVMVTNLSCGIDIREKGIFRSPLGRLMCAVCPECGYAEMYVDDTEGLKY